MSSEIHLPQLDTRHETMDPQLQSAGATSTSDRLSECIPDQSTTPPEPYSTFQSFETLIEIVENKICVAERSFQRGPPQTLLNFKRELDVFGKTFQETKSAQPRSMDQFLSPRERPMRKAYRQHWNTRECTLLQGRESLVFIGSLLHDFCGRYTKPHERIFSRLGWLSKELHFLRHSRVIEEINRTMESKIPIAELKKSSLGESLSTLISTIDRRQNHLAAQYIGQWRDLAGRMLPENNGYTLELERNHIHLLQWMVGQFGSHAVLLFLARYTKTQSTSSRKSIRWLVETYKIDVHAQLVLYSDTTLWLYKSFEGRLAWSASDGQYVYLWPAPKGPLTLMSIAVFRLEIGAVQALLFLGVVPTTAEEKKLEKYFSRDTEATGPIGSNSPKTSHNLSDIQGMSR